MTFAQPALLSLVALAGVPVLIHLLVARWAPVEPWAAMRFLTAVTPTRRRSVLRDRLVLAARAAALALAAVAAAGPRAANVGDAAAGPVADDPPMLTVAILDDTLSTARPRGDGPAFAELKRTALALTETAGPRDRFALIRTAKAAGPTGPPRVSGLLGASEFRREVAAARTTNAAGDAPAALAAAAELIDRHADRFPAGRAALLTDRAAADWAGPAVTAGVERLRAAGREGTAVTWSGPPGPGPPGRTLAALTVGAGDPDPRLDARPRTGRGATLFATVRTFGPRPAGSVAFSINDRFVGRAPLPATNPADLAPIDRAVGVPATFAEPGLARVEARLENEPGPPALATRFAVAPVRDALRLLIAADAPLGAADLSDGPGSADDPAVFFEQALRAEPETFAATRAALEDLPSRDLTTFDAVICVGAPPVRSAAALRAALGRGAGVVVTLRPGDDPEALRALFTGPLGAIRAGDAVGATDPADPAATGYSFAFARDLFADATDNAPGWPTGLRAVDGEAGGLTVGYRRLSIRDAPRAGAWPVRVVARFADETGATDDPAVLTLTDPAGPTGGRAAVLATSADVTWGGPWPATGAGFVPLIRGLVLFAALPAPRGPATTGDVLSIGTPPGIFAHTVRVVRPDGSERLIAATEGGVTFAETGEPGFYRFAPEPAGGATSPDTTLVAVNAPPSEADPRTVSPDDPGEPAAARPAGAAEPRSLSAWFWAAALGLLLIEPALARGPTSSRAHSYLRARSSPMPSDSSAGFR